jgi:hypothetical protein
VGAAALLLGVFGYFTLHRAHRASVAKVTSDLSAAIPADRARTTLPGSIEPAAAPSAASAVPEASATTAPSPPPRASADVAPSAVAAPPAAGSAEPSRSADQANGITVTVNTLPPKAQFFHFGKRVGTAPFVVQLKPGERHAYEVGLPGHITRRLVLDGSKTEITLGLRDAP